MQSIFNVDFASSIVIYLYGAVLFVFLSAYMG